jgi:hypothetical protein
MKVRTWWNNIFKKIFIYINFVTIFKIIRLALKRKSFRLKEKMILDVNLDLRNE